MKALTLTILAISAGISAASAQDRIDTKSEFLSKVAGKKIEMSSNTWLNANKDGKIDGRIKGMKVNGSWYWEDGYWCRSARVGGIFPVQHECQELSVAGNKLILQRFKGEGSKHTYQIN